MFPLKIYSQKNDLATFKIIFFDVIGCSIEVYNFILLSSSIEKFNVPSNPN